MTPEDQAFARDWYDTGLTVEQIAAKYGVAEGEVRVRAINRLDLGPRNLGVSKPLRGRAGGPTAWSGIYRGVVPDRRKEIGL